jgi:uracil-DNA glycosylase family 4
MRWTERRRAMLLEMGIRVWPRLQAGTGAEAAAEPTAGQRTADERESAETSSSASPAAARVSTVPTGLRQATDPPARVGKEAGAVAAMGWSELREAVSRCRACRLCESRTQIVFGVGNPNAHWMIVGEAPGEQEDLAGEPFVGKSGQLLDNMLRAVHLTRGDAMPQRQVYIANTVKCRPPGNRNPQPDELAQCEPYLIRQVALVKPKIILAMGRFAVQSLLRSSEPIGRLRGRVHDYHGVPLIVTYHPAYLLRNLPDKARAWEDLCLAVETVTACTAA